MKKRKKQDGQDIQISKKHPVHPAYPVFLIAFRRFAITYIPQHILNILSILLSPLCAFVSIAIVNSSGNHPQQKLRKNQYTSRMYQIAKD